MIFQEFTNYLQMSPGSVSNFFLVLAKWSMYHTHISLSDKSLFLHETPCVKSTLHCPQLVHQEDTTKEYLVSNFCGSIYWLLCVLLLHLSVHWSSEMQFGMIYLETWGDPQVYVAFSTLEFHPCFFVLGRTHMTLNSVTLHKAVSVVSFS
jgi:hypothetical protein